MFCGAGRLIHSEPEGRLPTGSVLLKATEALESSLPATHLIPINSGPAGPRDI